MHLSRSRLSARGTSLIEAMAALVVFSVGILGVMQMNVLASQQNNLARSRTTATRIARDVADSFERLPFDHWTLNVPTNMTQEDPNFDDINNADGLVTLEQAMAPHANSRPILGSADAIFASEGESSFYKVAWRALQISDREIRVLVMVTFPTPGGGTGKVTTWAIKTNPKAIANDPLTTMEF